MRFAAHNCKMSGSEMGFYSPVIRCKGTVTYSPQSDPRTAWCTAGQVQVAKKGNWKLIPRKQIEERTQRHTVLGHPKKYSSYDFERYVETRENIYLLPPTPPPVLTTLNYRLYTDQGPGQRSWQSTDCGMDDPCSTPGRKKGNCSLLQTAQTGSGVHPASK